MGDKVTARKIAKEGGVPVLPSSEGAVASLKEAISAAKDIGGYPVILKAAGGGGGRGMRVVRSEGEMAGALRTAQAEARAAFKSNDIYVEKLVEKARHVEVQILGDHSGNVVHLGERDCSAQRRYQKLLEESPASGLSSKTRRRIWDAGVKCARAVNYHSAGTVEFLVAPSGDFYFLEMNTRIQVEHPVTEMVTGIDLIAEQIRVAAGEKLRFRQKDLRFSGHAIECRINAEDPTNGFSPCAGTMEAFHPAGGLGVRVDTHGYTDYKIPPHYDSLIAKLIVHASTREEAIGRMRRALDEFIIEGVKTTIPFHQKLLNHPTFLEGDVHTGYVDEILAEGTRVEF